MSQQPARKELFRLNGNPTLGESFPQALQHVLAMLIGNITPPIIIANAIGLPEADKILLTQAAMIIGGLTTLLQLFPVFGFGMGLPNVMGVAFAYVPVLLTIGKTWGIEAIFGAQIFGGLASILIGAFIGKIRKFFPPIVSGTVVLAIGLSLYGTAINYIAGGTVAAPDFGSYNYWIVAIITLMVTLTCNLKGKGYFKISGMLIGILAGYLVSVFILGVDFAKIGSASWFALPNIMKWGLEFEPGAIILMILMYIVQAVQTIGDVSSTTIGSFGRQARDTELGGAIKGQGLMGIFGALIGGLPTDPYSQNVGLIVTTKVVAKKVFVIVSAVILVAGFIPKFGALMTTIPFPVLGGATITVFAAITMSGIQLITEQPMTYRNKMIVGISLAVGMGLYMQPKSLQFFPQLVRDIMGGSPIVVCFLAAFLLNIIFAPSEDDKEPAEAVLEITEDIALSDVERLKLREKNRMVEVTETK